MVIVENHSPTLDGWKLSYIAGIFDGEGCVLINGSNFSVIVTIINTHRGLIDYIHNHFPGSLYIRRPNHSHPHYKPVYIWRIICSRAIQFLRDIAPFTIVKKERIGKVLDFYDRRHQMTKTEKRIIQKTLNNKDRRHQ